MDAMSTPLDAAAGPASRPDGSGTDRASVDWRGLVVTGLLVGSLVLAAGSVFTVASMDPPGNTEFALLTRTDSGTLVADGYPRRLVRGEDAPVVLEVTNTEPTARDYTVVVLVERVRFGPDGTPEAVTERRERRPRQLSVPAGSTRRVPYELAPTLVGETVRVRFLLYRGDPPPSPAAANAHRELHLWLNVSAATPAQRLPDERSP